jgi:hypothetical protein
MELINKEFIGKVLPDKDKLNQGRYYVHIPELQTNVVENIGIPVKNHVHNYRVTPSQDGIYGSYFPLHANTIVIVKFFINHLNSGYIDRIISDADSQCLPFKIVDRDNYYQIIRTPKKDNLFAIYEGSTEANIPKNSIHLYFNNNRTVIVIDEEGITFKTDDNLRFKAKKNIEFISDQEIKTFAKQNISTLSNQKIKLYGKTGIEQKSDDFINLEATTISSLATANNKVQGNAGVHITGATIHQQGAFDVYCSCHGYPLKTGTSAPADPVTAISSFEITPKLITKKEYPYFETTG